MVFTENQQYRIKQFLFPSLQSKNGCLQFHDKLSFELTIEQTEL